MSLDVWPALPLFIQGGASETSLDNVLQVDELEHRDRISNIQIYFNRYTTWEIEKLWTAIQVPFPELAGLYLSCEDKHLTHVPVLPDSFLGGSAPRLQ